MLNTKIQKNNNAGFSLVEMLVATGVFMSIMTIAISSLISIIDANKKAQAIKNTIDVVTFAVENISRDMRMGTDYRCKSTTDGQFVINCPLDTGSTAVKYSKSLTEDIIYSFNGSSTAPGAPGVLTKMICSPSCGSPVDLISQDANVNITDMKFYVIGADNERAPQAQRTQPRVLITISGLISLKGSETSFNLQTGISQRARR